MKTGICPKCSSTDIRHERGFRLIATSAFRSARFTVYICATCGYMENYFADPKELAKIQSLPKVVPACAQCGYNLTGNVSGACPECGTRTSPTAHA